MPELIALDIANSPEFVVAVRHIWDAGNAFLPLDSRLPAPAKKRLLDLLRPREVWTADNRVVLGNFLPLHDGDAVVIATSGTTGQPKGVVLDHAAISRSAELTNARIGVDPASDKWYACLPFAHIGGLSVLTRALHAGVPVSASPAVDSLALSSALASGHTLVALVVATLTRTELSRWRRVILGGSTMPTELPPNVLRTYGMTETGSGIVYNGKVLDQVSIKIRDFDRQILVQTPTLARGYRTAQGFVPLELVDGWYYTGDAGYIDEDGLLTVNGRIGEVIVTGGEKVWPQPVEKAMATAPGVVDVAVCGIDDPTWGSAVVALVVPNDDTPTLESLRDHVKRSLPAYCAPQKLVLVKAIPRTLSGKIRRAGLSSLADPTTRPADEVEPTPSSPTSDQLA